MLACIAKFIALCWTVLAASDGDRVALQSMRFATPHSAGATCMTLGQLSTIHDNTNGNGSTQQRSQDAADDQVHMDSRANLGWRRYET